MRLQRRTGRCFPEELVFVPACTELYNAEIALFPCLRYIPCRPMAASPYSILFHIPGPGATLDYLWSRLGNRDLSQDEALAMISAVHRQLGQAKAEDPSVYASYSRFMQSLGRQMPVVHDFVVAKWSESRYANRRVKKPQQDDGDFEPAGAEVDRRSDASAIAPTKDSPTTAPERDAAEGEEPADPGEPDEEDEDPQERVAETAEAKEEPAEGEEDEAEEAEAERGEKADEEDQEEEEPEALEDSAEGAEAQEEGEEAEQQEADEEGQEEAEGEAEESEEPEAEAPEAEKGEADSEKEGELPEEEPEPPELDEGDEGEEGAEGAAE